MAEIRVLIVENMERVRQDLRTFLTLTGDIAIVGEASNGLDAIHLAESLCPQVILMDLEMPVLDGYEATRRIKALEPSCRIIALTIHDGEAEQDKAFRAGADDFITKEPSLDRLLASIHKLSTLRPFPEGDRT
jgi:NarL family two-component system response regulator LiaR